MVAERTVLPVIVGTAGHVHHGKSALVKLLTGCETMRLPEERARQLTIDLGFAPCRFSDGRTVGIVDVPGHEDFLRNMVAGAASVDAVLLVVAASEGVMPQTAEHVRILRVLRQPPLLAVITKTDLVDADQVELARSEVASFLATAGFPDAPIVACSSKTGEGLEHVWDGLEKMVTAVNAQPRDARAFRLHVERSFQVAGHGTVVTGIPVSGQAAPGDPLEILPGALPSAVRGVQVYKRTGAAACAGTCVAINLRDVGLESVPRGAAIAAPGWYRLTSEAVVSLASVAADQVLPRIAQVRVHAGTASVTARARLLDGEHLAPGGTALVHLRLDAPLLLAACDRVLVRLLTPPATIGGGLVVTVRPERISRRDIALLKRLQAAADRALAGDHAGAEFLGGPEPVLPQSEALRLLLIPGGDSAAHPFLRPLGPGWWLIAPRVAEVAAIVGKAVDRLHRAQPNAHGLDAEHTCAALGLPATAFPALAAAVADAELVVRHNHLARASHAPVLGNRLSAARDKLLACLTDAGDKPPARGDLQTELGLPERDFAQLIRLGAEAGDLRLLGNHVVAAATYRLWHEHLLTLFRASKQIDLAGFRAATGLSRNLAVDFLDLCDRDGLTRRVGNARVLARGNAI